MQAPSHLLTDVTEAGVGGYGRRREEGRRRVPLHQGTILHGVPPSMNNLRGGNVLENPHEDVPINNYECLFP